MGALALFTDGSVHPPTGIGFAAYFVDREIDRTGPPELQDITIKRFEQTTAAKLELSALLWALEEMSEAATYAKIHTDSQTIAGLMGRRSRLEQADFRSNAGRLLSNHELYRAFYRAADQWQFTVIKLEGHTRLADTPMSQQIFARVDQAARRALRDAISKEKLI